MENFFKEKNVKQQGNRNTTTTLASAPHGQVHKKKRSTIIGTEGAPGFSKTLVELKAATQNRATSTLSVPNITSNFIRSEQAGGNKINLELQAKLNKR